jgi:dipeptidyl aminopeptidase/acylaminoacyl peptidase
MERVVNFKNNQGFKLVGVLKGLQSGAELPVVVFAHGLHSGKDSPRNIQIAKGLNDKGLATFLLDFTGHGESEGTMADVSVERLASDLNSAVTFLESTKGVDSKRIGICGSSFGGTAALVAASSDRRIRILVLRSAPVEGYYSFADKVTIPTLVVQGEADPIVRESMELIKHLRGEKKIELIKGAGHLYERPEQLEQAKSAIVKWFTQKLRVR